MARAAGVSVTGLQRIKEGGDPRASTVVALSRGLGVPVAELLLGAQAVADEPAPYQVPRGAGDCERWRAQAEAVLAQLAAARARPPPAQIRRLIDYAAAQGLDAEGLAALVRLIDVEPD